MLWATMDIGALALGAEGIVSKRVDTLYRSRFDARIKNQEPGGDPPCSAGAIKA